jgi:hypothetical protein
MEQLIMRCLEKNPHDRPGERARNQREPRSHGSAAWTEEDAGAWWERNLPATSTLRTLPATVTDRGTLERV